ncbi:MAG TPA: hypothetical protein VFB62_11825 [Polyangiaceae bacterium]|jgi:hypothetical protein|nr:hypothetical protein [Polyangiaceae bacterium]
MAYIRVALVLSCAAAACSLVNAPDDPQEEEGTGGTSAGGMTACQTSSECTHLDDECASGFCQDGTCVAEPHPADTACGDPEMTECSEPDTCDGAGTCLPNHGRDGVPCASLCSDNPQCMAGECVGGNPIDCSGSTIGCDKGVCDPATGMCTTMPETMCMDNDACCPTGCDENSDIDCSGPSGTVRHVLGNMINVVYVPCGSGAPNACTADVAKSSCTAVGRKVVSHASIGNNQVLSLGATASCNYSISYFVVNQPMPAGSCLVGISNLDWDGTSCCLLGQWHGNTVTFAAPNATFGYVNPTESGYVASFPNVMGATWGCNPTNIPAISPPGCITHYVACAL